MAKSIPGWDESLLAGLKVSPVAYRGLPTGFSGWTPQNNPCKAPFGALPHLPSLAQGRQLAQHRPSTWGLWGWWTAITLTHWPEVSTSAWRGPEPGHGEGGGESG